MDRLDARAVDATQGRHGKPSICFVAPHAWPILSASHVFKLVGGSEMQQCHIARGLASRGYAVSMLCLDFGQSESEEVDGVRVHRLFRPKAGLPVVRFLHPRLTGLWRGMHIANADIYYHRGADMHTGVVAAFCRRHRRRSIFAAASNADFFPDKPWIRRARDKWLFEYGLRNISEIITQNVVQQELCKVHYDRDSRLIHSCYPATAEQAKTAGGILWVGTIRRIKAPERFIALASALPGHQFTMIGGADGYDGDSQHYYESIRWQAEALPNLAFLGFVPPNEVESHFDQARLFVNTSDTEGFPNTFLQAWARGMPTVTLFDPGSIEEGEPVCSRARNLGDMANIVRALSCDDALWRQTGERCRRHYARNHSLDGVLDTYEDLLQGVPSTMTGSIQG